MINYDRKKKKIQAGNFHYDRKKKVPVICLAGTRTGKKKDTGGKFSLRAEKKKFQSSVWRVRDQLRPEKKKDTGEKFSLRPEKKSSSRLSGGCVNFWP